jgi:hypothetical protein
MGLDADRVDHQRVALIMADRISTPGRNERLGMTVVQAHVKMPEYASWGSQDRLPTNVEAAYKAVTGK